MSKRRGPSRFAVHTALAAFLTALVIAGVTIFTLQRPAGVGGIVSSGNALVGGPFTMVDENGATVTEKTLLGKPSMLFFGFTQCPVVCPTALYEMAAVLDELGEDAKRVNAIFVSVDPERDTPKYVEEYVRGFHPRLRGFTGTVEQVQRMAKAYRVYFRKVPLDNGDYTVDHTALIYLMDADGKFVAPLNLKQEPDKAAAPIRALLK